MFRSVWKKDVLMIKRKLVEQLWDGMVEAAYISMENGNSKVFALLESHPELLNVRFHDHQTPAQAARYGIREGYPIQQAVFDSNVKLLERLIALGADVNAVWGNTALAVAVEHTPGSIHPQSTETFSGFEMLELLLEAGADPNIPDGRGKTVLMDAIRKSQAVKTVSLLLRYGAAPNLRDEQGRTALHFWHGGVDEIEILHMMMAHGADLNAIDNQGETVLMSSIEGRSHVVAEMIEYGVDVHARGKFGWTALHEATMRYLGREDKEAIRLLLEAGVSSNVKDDRGYTPLHVAAACCKKAPAQMLLKAGADIHARSHQGETPWDMAMAHLNPFEDVWKRGCTAMAAFLEAHGAIPT